MDRTWRLTAVTLQPKLTGLTASPASFCLTDPALWRAGEGASPPPLSTSPRLLRSELAALVGLHSRATVCR